jgi:hypothetical protein
VHLQVREGLRNTQYNYRVEFSTLIQPFSPGDRVCTQNTLGWFEGTVVACRLEPQPEPDPPLWNVWFELDKQEGGPSTKICAKAADVTLLDPKDALDDAPQKPPLGL